LNETFKAGTVADTAGFGVKDADGDEIKLGSIGHIGINYTIIYKDNKYVCREAIQSKRKHEETQTQTPTIYDPELFYSPLETLLPESHEEITIEPFLAPERWLVETGAAVLEQANLVESDNPRVSPVALVRCSRGGKTRSMMELVKEIRKQDSTYGIMYVTLNTATPLKLTEQQDPVTELCVRIAFAALKDRKPHDRKEFLQFCQTNTIDEAWVEKWLNGKKCILFIDELNLLQRKIDKPLASFLKSNFLLESGRGLVFSSHVASLSTLMSSESNRQVITIPLPIIPSLKEARDTLSMPALSPQDALFLGLMPGLIVERKHGRAPTQRRVTAITDYVGTLQLNGPQALKKVRILLSTLLTGSVSCVDSLLHELMTADLTNDNEVILRWVPFHMVAVIQEVSQNCLYLPGHMHSCLQGIANLFEKFGASKWESGDAWEALFLIALIVRCQTALFDEHVVSLGAYITGNVSVAYNYPLMASCDFYTTLPLDFIQGIPLEPPESGKCAISIYLPLTTRT
jgi:hypothetical protein